MSTQSDCLNVAFNAILDSIGFTQRIQCPSESGSHTLDLGIECEEKTVFLHNCAI